MAAATYWAFPANYSAHALVQLLPPESLAGVDGQHEVFPAYRSTQVSLLHSPRVLQAALLRPGVADLDEIRRSSNPLAWLEKEVRADDSRDSEILALSLAGSNPDDLAVLLNAVIDGYIQETVQQKSALRQEQIKQLQQSYDKYEQIVRQKREEVRRREKTSPDSEPAPDHPLPVEEHPVKERQELRRVQSELKSARLELAAAEQKLKAAAAGAVPEAAIEEYLKEDPVARQHQARLAEIEAKIEEIERLAAPAVVEQLLERPRQERDAERDALSVCRKEARARLAARYGTVNVADVQASRDRLRERVAQLTDQERILLSRQIETLNPPRAGPGLPQPAHQGPADLVALRAEFDRATVALQKLGERLELLKAEPLTPPATVVQPAVPPQTRETVRSLSLAFSTACTSFFLVAFALVGREFRSQKVYALEDVSGSGIGVIGALPALPKGTLQVATTPDNEGDRAGQGPLMEAVDMLRAQLLRVADSTGLRVIMVTSALSGEGKTSLAGHLAASLARGWRKTLLVDGDLRHPQIHQQFEVALDPGFSEVLRGETELDDAIRSTPLSRLWLLPAGQQDSYAVQALAQAETQRLFESLKEQYDFIVVDSSPILPVADALSLGQHVDAVLFSVLTRRSRMPAVRSAHGRLAALGIRVLGTVVQGAREEIGDLKYHYPARTA
jgi:capsular exopolysaccharide synthesis family protein